jgi:hypothetical protein
LVKVSDNATVTFVYDGDGQLVKRVVEGSGEKKATAYLGDHYQVGPGEWTESSSLFGETGNDQYRPNMVSDENGRLYLTWYEQAGIDRSIYLATREPLGGEWSITPVITAITTTVAQPVVTVAPNQEVYLTWQQWQVYTDTSYYDIHVYRRSVTGSWQADQVITTSFAMTTPINVSAPSLATDGQENIYLAWENDEVYGHTIQVQQRNAAGE